MTYSKIPPIEKVFNVFVDSLPTLVNHELYGKLREILDWATGSKITFHAERASPESQRYERQFRYAAMLSGMLFADHVCKLQLELYRNLIVGWRKHILHQIHVEGVPEEKIFPRTFGLNQMTDLSDLMRTYTDRQRLSNLAEVFENTALRKYLVYDVDIRARVMTGLDTPSFSDPLEKMKKAADNIWITADFMVEEFKSEHAE